MRALNFYSSTYHNQLICRRKTCTIRMGDKTDKYAEGDIVWVNFDPSSGNEIKKRRPGLVVSRYEFNRSTLFAVICPITSTIKNIPTRYTLPKEMVLTGQIVISQLKSLDFHARKIEFADRLPVQDIANVDQIIEYIF